MYRGLGLAGRGNFLYNISVEERCGMQKIKQDEINIGANIRAIRLSRGIGQTELVRMVQLQGVDMTRECLVKIERSIQHIQAVQLRAIRDALDTTYDELLQQHGI